jgi:trk system potassium uptake protein TrkH
MMGLKDLKVIVKDTGLLLMLISVTMLVPVIVGLIYPDAQPLPVNSYDTIDDFILAAAAAFIVGAIFYFSIREIEEMGLKHAIAITVLFWPIASLFGALPIYTSGITHSFVDAYFESISGWTTTGLTTIAGGGAGYGADLFPHSINMWRHLMQFLGGIGVLLISIIVLTQARTGSESITIVASEFSSTDRIRPSITSTAKTLFMLFLLLLLVSSIILFVAGMNPFDAVTHAMSGLCTGGFSTHGDSLAYYDGNTAVQLAAVVVMIIGSTNFAVHLTVFSGNYKELLRNVETRSFIILLILFTTAGAIWLSSPSAYDANGSTALQSSFFHVVSAMTTTGWTTAPGGVFPAFFSPFFIFILTICMLIGGSSASTSGGIRQIRLVLILKSIWWHIRRALMPSTVVFPRSYHHIVKKTVTDSRMTDIYLFVSIYILTVLLSAFVLLAYGYSVEQSLFEPSSAISSTGMTSGVTDIGAPLGAKLILMIDMWFGRIDIIPVLLFVASFSRKFR